MTDLAFRVENLGKYYRIGARQKQTSSFGDSIKRLASSPFEYLATTLRPPAHEEILWALKDVSFQVEQGEVLGIIGPNGAGKSTLLKILSRITEPTTGRAEVYGRVGSLLEVGTGFHKELTGRENIYLNGAIMGMTKSEIDRKFNEIIEFSGVHKFIDTPVKRYSSGMYVRLAFSVAAHLEPEILLVDEVLAVGDADFQKKCLGKMSNVAKEGRTVLFVSHNMSAIQRLVDKCIWFDEGRIMQMGEPHQIIDSYLASGVAQTGAVTFADNPNLIAQILRFALVDKQGQVISAVDHSDDINLDIEFVVRDPLVGKIDVVGIISLVNGTGVYCFELADLVGQIITWSPGRYRLQIAYPTNMLNSGKYIARVSIVLGHKAYHNHPNTGEGVICEIVNKRSAEEFRKQQSSDVSVLSIQPDYTMESM